MAIFQKFKSSQETLCPITSLIITKIVDIENPNLNITEAFDFIKMGDNVENTNEYNYWHNLIITKTNQAVTYLV